MKTIDDLSPGVSGRTGSMASVLVVDDEIAVRSFAARVLEREGYSVFQATDGAEALEMLGHGAAEVDVVVTDVVMPRINGVEFMQALATSRPELPVLLMSGYAMGALADLGICVPCGIIAKPFSADRLIAEVQRCLGKK